MVYHSQIDSQTERINQEVKALLQYYATISKIIGQNGYQQ